MPLSMKQLSAILEEIPESHFPLEELPAETQWDIFLELPFLDLLKGCQTNRATAEICRSEAFWRRYNKKHFDITPDLYLQTKDAIPKKYSGRKMAEICYKLLKKYFDHDALPTIDSLKTYLSKQYIDRAYKIYERHYDSTEVSTEHILEYVPEQLQLYREKLDTIATETATTIKFPLFLWSDLFTEESIVDINRGTILIEYPAGRSFFKFVQQHALQPTRYFTPQGIITINYNANISNYNFFDRLGETPEFSDIFYDNIIPAFYKHGRMLYNRIAAEIFGKNFRCLSSRFDPREDKYYQWITREIRSNPEIDKLFQTYTIYILL